MAILEVLRDLPLATIAWYGLIMYGVNKLVTAVRNLYFHPLSNVPGPWISRISRGYEFWWDSVQHGRMWVKLPELHAKYGMPSPSVTNIKITKTQLTSSKRSHHPPRSKRSPHPRPSLLQQPPVLPTSEQTRNGRKTIRNLRSYVWNRRL